jgi:integrase
MGAEPLRVLQGGGAPRGWEKLWAKDVWGQTELPHGDLASMYRGEEFIRFERIAQPWLKEAAKRWARMRLLADTSPRTMSAYLVGVRRFSEWLAEHAPEVSMPAGLSRAVLEDYMLWVRHESPWKPATRSQRLLAVRLLLEEQREDGLAGLPAGAVIHGAELPRVDPGLPKTLPGEVFAQWIEPANLALLDERDRTIVLVLAFCGFRVSSVVTLMRGCVELGSDGHPYLRYFNVKASREAMLPIPPLLAEQLRRQEAHLAERYPDTEWLFPSRLRRGAKRGAFHIDPGTINLVVERYVRRAEICTAEGKLALDIYPHLFRHNVGTSMVNDNIPLTVIQEVLDHGSIEMTARYARLRDETVKQAVRRWHERVNIRGERIALPVDGPLEQAAWMKERIARAKQALPNGYCGLPLVQTCPHPNACLSCESFLTDGSFRAVHQQHQAETRRLLEKARKQGNVRLVEVLGRDEQSLTRILDGLDQIEAEHADSGGELDLRDLAAPGQTEGSDDR